MHEARWYREKKDADNRRTRASILRAAISNASNERTSQQWAREALFGHDVAPEQARAAPVEHSALPRWLEGYLSSISRFQSRFERHLSSILRLWGTPEQQFRASCGAGPGSSSHSASQLRLRARLERPFRAHCGSGAGSSGYFEPAAAPGQARATFSSKQRLRARLDVANVGSCGVFEAEPS